MTSADPKLDATLADWQVYVQKKIDERGFGDESVQQKFVLLVEEAGELAKALRPLEGIKTSEDSATYEVKHEIADVVWLVMCISNALGIDIDEALRSKEEKNASRVWK